MALTSAQRASIRKWMGWPVRWRPTTSNALEQAMDAISNAADEAEVTGILPLLADIDSKLTSALSCLKVSSTADVTLKADNGISILRSEGRRLVNRLSSLLGCPVGHDVFGQGRGPAADNYVGP